MYRGFLLTNIMVSADLSNAKGLDVTCEIRKLVFPIPSQHVQNKEMWTCVWCEGFNGNGIMRVNNVLCKIVGE